MRRKLRDLLIDQLVVGKSDNIVTISRIVATGSGIGRCGGVGGVGLPISFKTDFRFLVVGEDAADEQLRLAV